MSHTGISTKKKKKNKTKNIAVSIAHRLQVVVGRVIFVVPIDASFASQTGGFSSMSTKRGNHVEEQPAI